MSDTEKGVCPPFPSLWNGRCDFQVNCSAMSLPYFLSWSDPSPLPSPLKSWCHYSPSARLIIYPPCLAASPPHEKRVEDESRSLRISPWRNGPNLLIHFPCGWMCVRCSVSVSMVALSCPSVRSGPKHFELTLIWDASKDVHQPWSWVIMAASVMAQNCLPGQCYMVRMVMPLCVCVSVYVIIISLTHSPHTIATEPGKLCSGMFSVSFYYYTAHLL